MSVMKRRQTRLSKEKHIDTKKDNKPIKIEIIEKVIPKEEQILRERKEKQILHQKWEAQQLKKQIEEEKLEKLKRRFSSVAKDSTITSDHNGKALTIKKVNVQKLPPKPQPKFGVESVDFDKIKTIKNKAAKNLDKNIKGMFDRSLNVKNIVKGLDLDESDYIDDTNNTTFAGGSSNISLQMGVNLNQKDNQVEGPQFRISNRMTLNEYKIIANSRGKIHSYENIYR
jgi:hypothetical protein